MSTRIKMYVLYVFVIIQTITIALDTDDILLAVLMVGATTIFVFGDVVCKKKIKQDKFKDEKND